MVENPRKNENVPDLTDFMNDMFFGTLHKEKKAYNLTGGHWMDEEVDFDDSTRSNGSKMTQEWLEEAKRMVASSPSRCDSPSRLVGSPRFAAAQARISASSLDRRDPLSRSARRHRPVEGFGGEILKKASSNHTRNKSASLDISASPSLEQSPAAAVHKWFSNILTKTTNPTSTPPSPSHTNPSPDPTALCVPPRQSTHRRSRFQTENPAPRPPSQGIPVHSHRTFRTTPPATLSDPTTQLLSPPKNLKTETTHKRSLSSSKCSSPITQPLSPPKNLVESAHRRSISKSTCSIDQKVSTKGNANANGWSQEGEGTRDIGLNDFLKQQRSMIEKISYREVESKAKIVLPASSNSTSSMVAAICYAWLLENRMRKKKGEGDRERYAVAPVMNVRREKMWKHRQAAWLFHHVGLDATSLLFSDEVDLENLLMAGQLGILVVGEDVLRTNAEVGSQCTVLTDNYCEEAYDLLETPALKKLLLAGILLDTQNLDSSSSFSMTRDAEAVQLLFVGLAPNYRNNLFDNLMLHQNDSSFLEALRLNYGKPLNEDCQGTGAQLENGVPQRKANSVFPREVITQNSHKDSNDSGSAKSNKILTNSAKPNSSPAQATVVAPPTRAIPDTSRGKNKFFLARWFGLGSK